MKIFARNKNTPFLCAARRAQIEMKNNKITTPTRYIT